MFWFRARNAHLAIKWKCKTLQSISVRRKWKLFYLNLTHSRPTVSLRMNENNSVVNVRWDVLMCIQTIIDSTNWSANSQTVIHWHKFACRIIAFLTKISSNFMILNRTFWNFEIVLYFICIGLHGPYQCKHNMTNRLATPRWMYKLWSTIKLNLVSFSFWAKKI